MAKERREKTHERIAKMFNVKPHYVQSILTIGHTNKHYFERLRKGRIALYVASSACRSEIKKELAALPKDKSAVQFGPNLTGEDEPVSNLKQVPSMTFICNVCKTEHIIELTKEEDEEE